MRLFCIYEKRDDGSEEPLCVGVAETAERAVENTKLARAQQGIFQTVEYSAVPFMDAPFELRVSLALDCILSILMYGTASMAQRQRGGKGRT